MKSTKKLLSITNLKKYFPVAKSSIFQREQFYVRANEDISLDIYEGETIGIVTEAKLWAWLGNPAAESPLSDASCFSFTRRQPDRPFITVRPLTI